MPKALKHFNKIGCMLIMSSIYSFVFSQNLVPNPSFEDTLSCDGTGNINQLAYWVNPTSSTPDFLSSCTNGNFNVPVNVYGSQNARTGNSYVGLVSIINTSSSREYIQVQLTSALIAGKEYCVEFYVCTSDSSTYSINNIGAFLSTNAISSSNGTELICTPQIENSITSPLTQSNTWQLVSDGFIAVGGEHYITIGNFNSNNNTDTTMLNGSSWAEGYQYIDDVSVEKCGVNGINEESLNINIELYPNPSNGSVNISSIKPIKKYSVYSSIGKLIVSDTPHKKDFLLDLENYASSVYIIKFEIDNSIITKKLFINTSVR